MKFIARKKIITNIYRIQAYDSITYVISELKDLTKYRLDEINKVKEYFNAEIKEREDIVKKD